jgi:ubiquinone/menaquinone biosynthesis C-methylase UbiE
MPNEKDYQNGFDMNDPEIVSVIDEVSLWSAPFGMKLLEIVRLRGVSRALDVGCGLGFPLLELAMRLEAEAKVYGIDPWKQAIERARMKARVMGIRNVVIYEGVAESLPFDDEFFDLVVSNNGINNVQDLPKALKEIGRVSRAGAQFVATMNTDGTMIEFYDVFKVVLLEKGMTAEIAKMKEHIRHKRPALDNVSRLIMDAGFKISGVHDGDFSLAYADGTAMLGHFLIRLAFLDEWKKIVPADVNNTIFNEIERHLNLLAKKKDGLHLTVPFVVIDCIRK